MVLGGFGEKVCHKISVIRARWSHIFGPEGDKASTDFCLVQYMGQAM